MNITVHELSVQKEYFVKIQNGEKTVEGRAGNVVPENNINEDYKNAKTMYKDGDQIRFVIFGCEKSGESVLCKITKHEFFPIFKDMLTSCGLSKCLPRITDMDEAVRIYRSFSGFKEREIKFGVIGIHLKIV